MNGVATAEGKTFPVTFPDNAEPVRQAIEETGAVLLIIDPLFSFVSGATDSFKDDSIRRGALSPLKQIAEETEASIVLVRHLNKSQSTRAIYKGGGSIGITAAARSALLIAASPDDDELKVLAQTKSNSGRKADSLAYRIIQSHNDPSIPLIRWEGVTTATADELLA